MSYKILAINPGSTSTKAALFEDEKMLFELTLRHTAEELAPFDKVIDQFEWRRDLILADLKNHGVEPEELSAVVGRGGLVKPIESGAYEVNDALVKDSCESHLEHASNLGAPIARAIADSVGVRAFIADPVVVDEMEPVARISGLVEAPRRSLFHALNSKAIARLHAEKVGKSYEELNLLVLHMGGGVSVSVHKQGRVVDTYDAISGDGTFSPERAGRISAATMIDLCFSGKYTEAQLRKMIIGHGGIMAHLGTNSMQEVVAKVESGDKQAELILEAFCYNVSKDVGAMSTVLCGKVDGILITGGIAYNKHVTEMLEERCSFIAPVSIYPGENELESLAHNVFMVLTGKSKSKLYL
ncbi:MAG: butyrate kinase [Rikenellaceae bacterium]